MNRIDVDHENGCIVIYEGSSSKEIARLDKVSLNEYLKVLYGPIELFAYKNPDYSPLAFSLSAGRYNYESQGCCYTAESIRLAQLEIQSWQNRKLYKVNSPIIYYLDLLQIAIDYDFASTITQHSCAGGWEPTQKLQSLFTNHFGLTALRVPSSKNPNQACMDFYADFSLPDGFFIEVKI